MLGLWCVYIYYIYIYIYIYRGGHGTQMSRFGTYRGSIQGKKTNLLCSVSFHVFEQTLEQINIFPP